MFHGTMQFNNLKLCCVVEGESTTFRVKIDPSEVETIGELKGVIKEEKKPEFDDIAAYRLTLWQVSIPIPNDIEDRIPIVLDRIIDKTLLSEEKDISEFFEATPLKKTIHIVIQRPLHGTLMKTHGHGELAVV
jgi:hypothetical protein